MYYKGQRPRFLKDGEYRVIAVNKAGQGAQSNTVAAVVQNFYMGYNFPGPVSA